ncbi:MAG: YjbH domain-containing protein [Gammaproteobacteria bacterium]|nr:YjbH domain-containing protein [Gammaproteobacteria bacterium]
MADWQECKGTLLCAVLWTGSLPVYAASLNTPTQTGQTGLVNMPTARVAEDGTLRFGFSRFEPYKALWSSLSVFPRLELGARYTSVSHTRGLTNPNFGTFKDKAFDAKLLLLQEGHYFPAISIGTRDFLGTRVFDADFVVMSKQFGSVDISLGLGRGRLEGGFGGLQYQPAWASGFDLVYEYDVTDYANDRFAATSGAIDRKGGDTFSIGYRQGWLGGRLTWQGEDVGFNTYVSIPLMQREFIPKLDEPPPFTAKTERSDAATWRDSSKPRERLITALEQQGFRNVQMFLAGRELHTGFAHRRISLVARATGRALRTVLSLGPRDLDVIHITFFTSTDLALVTYAFHDLPLLEHFFAGGATYGELLKGMTVSYSSPDTARRLAEVPVLTAGQTPIPEKTKSFEHFQWVPNEEGHALSLRRESRALDRTRIIPFNAGIYFNDANGALRYETFALATWSQQLGRGLFVESGLRLRLLEDVSKVADRSNSVLPHVRSDVGDYTRDGDFILDHLLLNQYLQLRPRFYARASAGYYERMFAGVGGQLLYFSRSSPWAIDLSVDALRQRNTDGDFGFRDYRTTTAIAAVHYRLQQQGLTFTLRGGRFLARDVGVRYEIQRRFRSGVRIGAWYTVTDGRDITSPGSPDDPYNDKGIFLSIPLGSMLTRDTQATARFAVSPWTRDVGQMVKSPGDLYTIVEDPLLFDWSGRHLLSDFHQ